MKKNSFFSSLPFKLLVGVVLGVVFGLIFNATDTSGFTMAVLNIVVTLKYILGQVINFCVPLIIIGFIAPSITKLGNNASRMLGVAIIIAYASSQMCIRDSSFFGRLIGNIHNIRRLSRLHKGGYIV